MPTISKQIKIFSDGTSNGTKVLDANGNQIEGCITAVEWRVSSDGSGRVAEARVTFAWPQVEVTGRCPPEIPGGEMEPTRLGRAMLYLCRRGVSMRQLIDMPLERILELAEKHRECERAYG